jgi:membrane-associated phospholipid phosphatase
VKAGQLIQLWLVFLALTLTGVTVCIRWIDIPVAYAFLGDASRLAGLGRGFSSSILVAGEMTLIVSLAIVRLVRGSLSGFGKALFVASCASLSAFAANDYVLKIVFGRNTPLAYFASPTTHIFHFFQGDQHSSFPSGHMVMASAFAMTLMRLQPRTMPFLVILLCIGSVALVVGNWHFVGDVVAGAFVGSTAGFMAAELWNKHVQSHTPDCKSES